MPTTADRLAPLTALDLEGRPQPLGGLWADHAVILVFVRHFG